MESSVCTQQSDNLFPRGTKCSKLARRKLKYWWTGHIRYLCADNYTYKVGTALALDRVLLTCRLCVPMTAVVARNY